MDFKQLIENVKKWKKRKGKTEYLRHLEGGKQLTPRQAITAKCYECNCGYDDGTYDCNIPHCPLYAYMPFRVGGPLKKTDRARKAGKGDGEDSGNAVS